VKPVAVVTRAIANESEVNNAKRTWDGLTYLEVFGRGPACSEVLLGLPAAICLSSLLVLR
jgi:hypothetical protein